MKKSALLTISICAALFSAVCGSTYAAAENSATSYPDGFPPCAVVDYAVSENGYAFASDKRIVVCEGENKPLYFDAEGVVSGITYGLYDGANAYLYKNAAGERYILSESAWVKCEYEFKEETVPQPFGNGYYYSIKEGNINVWDGNTTVTPIEGNFSRLKTFNGGLYALNSAEGSYSLNKIDGVKIAETKPLIIDDYGGLKISAGDAAKNLKTHNLTDMHFCTLIEGKYITEIDLSEKIQDEFKIKKTYKIGDDGAPAANKSAFVLCESGNAVIVTFDGKCYILKSDSVRPAEAHGVSAPEADKSGATVCIVGSFAYSSPFVSKNTELFALSTDPAHNHVEITSVISANELSLNFYKIKYQTEEGEKTGYVPFGYLDNFTYNENEPTVTPDKNYSDGNAIRTVIIVLVVVALVLIAVGYLVFVSTSDKRKKKSDDKTEE